MAVQRDLQPAAEGETIDERKGRHRRAMELVEDGMADPRDRHGLVTLGDHGEGAQVSAGGQHERLARNRNRGDVGPRRRGVEGVVERGEPARTQRRRPRVIMTVVQRDQHRRLVGVWQQDVSAEGVSDDFLIGGRCRRLDQLPELLAVHAAASATKCGFSQITEPPMPSPMHIVVSP